MAIKLNSAAISYHMYQSTPHICAVGRANQTNTNVKPELDVKPDLNTVLNPLIQKYTKHISVEDRYSWLIKLEERYFCKVNTPQIFFSQTYQVTG